MSQVDYMFQMSGYLHLAKGVNEEAQFYDCFFKMWFERWPLENKDEEDISMFSSSIEHYRKIIKRVCVTLFVNFVNLNLLTSSTFFQATIQDFVYILAGTARHWRSFPVSADGDWRAGFCVAADSDVQVCIRVYSYCLISNRLITNYLLRLKAMPRTCFRRRKRGST